MHWGSLRATVRSGIEEKQEAERAVALQRVVDDVFVAIRARKLSQAHDRTQHVVRRGARGTGDRGTCRRCSARRPLWNEPRGMLALMDALIEKFCAERQVSLALWVAEQALKQSPQFAPARFECTPSLIRHAAHNGRRRFALHVARECCSPCRREHAGTGTAALRAPARRAAHLGERADQAAAQTVDHVLDGQRSEHDTEQPVEDIRTRHAHETHDG